MNAIFCSTEARSDNNDNILEPCFHESNNTNKADGILARGVSLQNMLPNSYVYLDSQLAMISINICMHVLIARNKTQQ